MIKKHRDKIILEMPETGECKIDIDKLVEYWSSTTKISKYKNEYRLIISNKIKISISEENAIEVIKRLSLSEEKSIIFENASIFK